MPEALRTMMTGGLKFDGVNDYVSVPNSVSLNIANKITIGAWIKRATTDSWHGIVAKWNYLNNKRQYALQINNNNRISFSLSNDGYPTVELTSMSTVGTAWVHIMSVWDGSSMRIFLNGGQDQNTDSFTNTIYTSDAEVNIGILHNIRIFDGLLNDVRIYNRALSPSEIQQLYQGKNITNGLVLHLPLTEGEGTTAYDRSGYGNHGTIYGADWTVKKNKRVLAPVRVVAQ